MKNLLTALVIAVLVPVLPAVAAAQEAGSSAALDIINRTVQRQADMRREHQKDIEAGRNLFGADERWNQSKLRGPLYDRHRGDFVVGDWGCTSMSFTTISKVSDTEYLVLPEYRGAEVMLLRGLDTSKVTDGIQFALQHPVVIPGTYDYTTVSGARKTVLVLECNKDKFNEAASIREKAAKAALEAAKAALFRKWSDSSSASTVVAEFIEVKNSKVRLERKDNGKEIEVPLSRLSEDDQKWIRDELKRRKKSR